jgi:hypothetical protein
MEFQNKISTRTAKTLMTMFNSVKLSFSLISVRRDKEVVETAINIEHINELIKTRGINGAKRKSSHSNLKNAIRIK